MGNDSSAEHDKRLERQVDALQALVDRNSALIEDLQEKSQRFADRATASEARADQDRAAMGHERGRIDGLEERAKLDRVLINMLRDEGLLKDERAEQLEAALITARRIGAAIGIVMATFKVDEKEAFEMVRVASQNTNIKLRVLADGIAETGDVSQLAASGQQAASS